MMETIPDLEATISFQPAAIYIYIFFISTRESCSWYIFSDDLQKEFHSFPLLQLSPFNSCHITRHHTHLLFCLRRWKVMERSLALKQKRNETRVISTMWASLPPPGLLSSTQETNLLNTLLMACQKGVKKKKKRGRRVVGKKRCLQLRAQSHLPMRTLSHSRIPHLQLAGRGA